MTLQEIKDTIKHCGDVNGDPCYHCAQKLWLLQELEKAQNPMVQISEPVMTPKMFADEIEKLSQNPTITFPAGELTMINDNGTTKP